jgi:dUTP pyrophosphatase
LSKVTLQLQWLDSEMSAHLPAYQTDLAAGMDFCSSISAKLSPMERILIPCGFAMGIPKGFEVQVRPRSGLAYKHGITVLNAPGTIDADYTGELKVLLINFGDKDFKIQRGDRIAQIICASVDHGEWEVVSRLGETTRGSGGFGHTGTSESITP